MHTYILCPSRSLQLFAEPCFYAGVVVSIAIALLYFRDLGDIPQLIMKTKRSNVDRFIRNE